MFLKISATKTNTFFKALGVLILCVAILFYSKDCTNGALKGLTFCFNVLIPSLFPFMAISSFIVNSGLSYQIGRPFGFIMKKLFGLNSCFAPVLILSVIGGYPVGAKGICSLYKNGLATEHEAKKASLFCVCAGPGFIINFMGVSLCKNEQIGVIIFVSQLLSVFILGIIINLFDKDRKNINCNTNIKRTAKPISTAIVESATDSSKGILNICAFVIIFSAFTQIIEQLLSEGLLENSLFCLLEVCSAVDNLSKNSPIEVLAFAAGFGGLCVHFQIFSALEDVKVSKFLFFVIRIIQGGITALLTYCGLMLFPNTQTVFSSNTVQNFNTFGGTVISGVALVVVAICFLYSLKNYKQN